MTTPLPAAQVINDAIRSVQITNEPTRMLAVMDISGSMLGVVPGRRRGDPDRPGQGRGDPRLGLYGPDSDIGLWVFSRTLTPDSDHRELIPVSTLGPDGQGGTGAQRLAQAMAGLQAIPEGGTGLYDTVLDAVRTMRASYDPARVNVVLVLTDGMNDDQGSISLDGLISTLTAEQDPNRPVPVISIAFGPDSDVQALSADQQGHRRRVLRIEGSAADRRDLPGCRRPAAVPAELLSGARTGAVVGRLSVVDRQIASSIRRRRLRSRTPSVLGCCPSSDRRRPSVSSSVVGSVVLVHLRRVSALVRGVLIIDVARRPGVRLAPLSSGSAATGGRTAAARAPPTARQARDGDRNGSDLDSDHRAQQRRRRPEGGPPAVADPTAGDHRQRGQQATGQHGADGRCQHPVGPGGQEPDRRSRDQIAGDGRVPPEMPGRSRIARPVQGRRRAAERPAGRRSSCRTASRFRRPSRTRRR